MYPNEKKVKNRNVKEPEKQNALELSNYKLLKTSWNVQAKLFFERSTLHGVRYTAEEGRPIIEKLMWFCCVSIGAVATMVIIVSLWEKFQTNPTITGLDTDFHNWDVQFPAITICQSDPANLSTIQEYVTNTFPNAENAENLTDFFYTLSKFSYDNLAKFKYYSNKGYVADDVDLKNYIYKLMNKCEDIFDECIWKSENYTCCEGFFPIFTESGYCYVFNSKHSERYMPWYDGELPRLKIKYIEETDVKWSLKWTVLPDNAGVSFPIYIHNADDVSGVDIQPQHTWNFKVGRVSFSVKQTYTTDDTKQLSIKQRKCIFDDEITLKINHVYTYSSCARQCRMETAKRFCGCIPYFYPEIEGFRHCKIKELACIADHVEAILLVDRCHCQLGCSNAVYEVEKLYEHANVDEANWGLEAQFVSWPMVRYKREVLFGWVDLLVSFGGIAGLFLGFSLLSGVEIIYYFTIRACCMVNREPMELQRIDREEVTKVKPSYDLSLVPYFVRKSDANNGFQEVAKGYYNFDLKNSSDWKPGNLKKRNKIFHSDNIKPPFGIEFLP